MSGVPAGKRLRDSLGSGSGFGRGGGCAGGMLIQRGRVDPAPPREFHLLLPLKDGEKRDAGKPVGAAVQTLPKEKSC